MASRRPLRKLPGAGGFTLVEIMVVVLIAGILAVIAIQGVRKIEINSRSSRVANDLRIFASGFTAYAQQFGAFPVTALPGVIPTGMAPYLQTSNWSLPTAIGGYFCWESNVTFAGKHYNGCILIETYKGESLTSDTAQLTDLDSKIDDGNLAKGIFFKQNANHMVYVVDQ